MQMTIPWGTPDVTLDMLLFCPQIKQTKLMPCTYKIIPQLTDQLLPNLLTGDIRFDSIELG